MPEPFAVAALGLGALLGQLATIIREAWNSAKHFRDRLESLERSLKYLEPIIKEIESLNEPLDRPKEEITLLWELLEKCKVTVEKAPRVKLYKRPTYSDKLKDLEDGIIKFAQLYGMVNSRDTKQILVEMQILRTEVRRLIAMQEGGSSSEGTRCEIYGRCEVPKAPEYVVGLVGSIKELKKFLLAGGATAIVVSANGGCGKTTLVETLVNEEEIKAKFKNNIFFVTFSQSPNFTAIVQNMFNHMGKNVPRIETDKQGIDQLQKLLIEIGREDPVLLVIDDVWSDSQSLLKNFLFDKIQDYKILVTSRSKLLSFDHQYKLNPLNDEDARKLFLRSATPYAGSTAEPIGDSSRDSPSMNTVGGSMVVRNKLIDKVVRRCKGSPLALTVVGKTLCGEHPEVWESKLLKWSEGHFVDSNKDIFDCLKKSVDDLDEEHKAAFLDFGSFPEDHVIPARALTDMWIELHGLDVDGIHAKGILRKLAAKNLIDVFATKSEGAGFCSYFYVRQHDDLREVAIHLNSLQGPIQERIRLHMDIRNNKFPDWCTTHKDQTLNARLLSISTGQSSIELIRFSTFCTTERDAAHCLHLSNNTVSVFLSNIGNQISADAAFASDWHLLDLPSVEVLVLNFRTKNYTLPTFIAKMVSLKTLIITNNGFFPAELSNFTVLESLPNLKRIRFERIEMPSHVRLYVKGASFFMCEMMDTIAMPNLEEMDISYCSEIEGLPAGLRESPNLKKVSITSCHNLQSLPDEIGDLSELQVLRLSSCLSLSALPKSIEKLKKLAFLDISDCFSIEELPDEIGGLSMLEELHMKGCLGLSVIPETVVKLEQLEYVLCDEQRALLWTKRRLSNRTKVESVREEINLNWLLK